MVLPETDAGVKGEMNREKSETQEVTWEDDHPWLVQQTKAEDDDSVDEVIRYTLDELRFA